MIGGSQLLTAGRMWYLKYARVWCCLGLAALVFVAFGRSAHYDFVWDDRVLIGDNPAVRDAAHWYRLLGRNFWQVGDVMKDPSRTFYRPVVMVSYLADHAVWGLNPHGFHLTNLLTHILGVWFVFHIALALFGRHTVTAFFAAALFAVHPSHVENV